MHTATKTVFVLLCATRPNKAVPVGKEEIIRQVVWLDTAGKRFAPGSGAGFFQGNQRRSPIASTTMPLTRVTRRLISRLCARHKPAGEQCNVPCFENPAGHAVRRRAVLCCAVPTITLLTSA